jgi:predicted nucleic acid-binding protein
VTALVVDASAVASLLLGGDDATWVADVVTGAELVAPALLPFEVTSVIRRHDLAGLVSPAEAALAHADLLDLPVDLVAHALVAARTWELRHNLSAYDASYVAVAEAYRVPLVTLDRRLAEAPGVTCPTHVPPA